LLVLLLVPLLMSYVIKIYAVRSILGGNGMLNRALLWLGIIDKPSMLFVFNMNAVLLTLTVLLIPFAVLPIFLSLERIPKALRRLGRSRRQQRADLPGASPCRSACPASLSAASFVFVLAIGDFLTPQMVGGQSAASPSAASSTASSARPLTGRSARRFRWRSPPW
jgi:spermidine/putrescine transport system permease protein